MSCQCGTTATGEGVASSDAIMGQTNDSNASGLTIGGKTICTRCLLFWIAVGIVVLLIVKRS